MSAFHIEVNEETIVVAEVNDLHKKETDGLTDKSHVILISDNLRGREYLETLFHEILHILCPNHAEEKVLLWGEELSKAVYNPQVLLRAGFVEPGPPIKGVSHVHDIHRQGTPGSDGEVEE